MARSPQIQVSARKAPQKTSLRCPYCRESVEAGPAACCPDCGLALHTDCARELEGCPSLGCPGSPVRGEARIARRRLRLALWRFGPLGLPGRIENSPRASGFILETGQSSASNRGFVRAWWFALPLVVVVLIQIFSAAPPSEGLAVLGLLVLFGLITLVLRPFLKLLKDQQERGEAVQGRLSAVRALEGELRFELADLRTGRTTVITLPAGLAIDFQVSDEASGPRLTLGAITVALPQGWTGAQARRLGNELERIRLCQTRSS